MVITPCTTKYINNRTVEFPTIPTSLQQFRSNYPYMKESAAAQYINYSGQQSVECLLFFSHFKIREIKVQHFDETINSWWFRLDGTTRMTNCGCARLRRFDGTTALYRIHNNIKYKFVRFVIILGYTILEIHLCSFTKWVNIVISVEVICDEYTIHMSFFDTHMLRNSSYRNALSHALPRHAKLHHAMAAKLKTRECTA